MFKKDILIVDFETTGFSIDTDEPVQIGFVLLDKKTLEEKLSFVSWIRPQQKISAGMEAFQYSGITPQDVELIKKAPPLEEVASQIAPLLPNEYTFAAWNVIFDFAFWKKMMVKIGMYPNTAHVLELWTVAYMHLIRDSHYTGAYKSEPIFQYFGLDPREKHDALGDARCEAEVLRKIVGVKSQPTLNL